jgi:hypothetical protein
MKSTLLVLSALTTLSAKFCTAQGLLDEESPGFVVTQSFGGGQPQVLRDLRPIHVSLMAEVEQGRVRLGGLQRGAGCVVHTGILLRVARAANASPT